MADSANASGLFVVITDFDGWAQTEVCLQRLSSSSSQGFRVIVVDHGTSDATAKGMLAFPDCLRLSASSELWWAGATNVGIRRALELGAKRIMLLNNDCFVSASTIEALLSLSGDDTDQIVAPVQLSAATGDVLVARAATCFALGFPTMVLPYMRKLPASAGKLLPTGMIVGGRGVVIPSDTFEAVGLFDEEVFPHYAADHDFYMRCRKRGIPMMIAAQTSVDIDDTRTSVATNLGSMPLSHFLASFGNPRSHRNFATLVTLFKRYYPLRPLYFIGVALNVLRYGVSYIAARLLAPFRS